MGTIVVGNKLEVLTHVVASRLLSAALGALAINVGAGNILAHNCIAVSAQNIVGAIVVGNKLEVLIHVVASRLKSAAGLALAININAAKLVHNCLANFADDLVGAMAGALVLPAIGRVIARAGVGSNLLMTAANAGGLTVTVLVDVSHGIDDSTIFSADVRAGTIAVVDTDLIDMVTLSSSGSKCSGDHGHCHHSGQNDRCNPRNSLLSQFHKTTSKIFCVSEKEESLSRYNTFLFFWQMPALSMQEVRKTARETSSKVQTPCSGRCRVLFCVPGGLQAPPDQILQHFGLGAVRIERAFGVGQGGVQRRGDGHRIGFSWLLHRSAHLPSEAGSVVH